MRRTRTPLDRSTVHRSTLAGVAAGLALGGGVALVAGLPSGLGAMGAVGLSAQSDTSTTGTTTGANADPRAVEHEAHLRDALAPLVDDGTLTASQVDAIVTALAGAHESDRGDRGQGDRMGHGPRLDAVAELLGLTVADVESALHDGQSLADLAAAHGSNAEAVVEVLIADLKAHLDEEVAAGEHTQTEADERLADASDHIAALVNGESMGGDMHGPGMHGPGMHGPGMHGDMHSPGMHGPGRAHGDAEESAG